MTSRFVRWIAVATAAFAPVLSGAQTPTPPTPVTPSLDFSGVIFGSYGYRTDSAAAAALGGKHPNQFALDRAYLNFRMPAGANGQIRITTDVFQNTNSATNGYYQGWAIRIKYGYLQYTGLRNRFGDGSSLVGRVGVLHNVITEHIDGTDGFWPRYLGTTSVERHGFFASADGGIAGLLTLGKKWGEVYGTITNGPGYTAFDRDRFKDFALRASFTPFATHDARSAAPPRNPFIRSFTISPWAYKGWTGSTFAAGGPGQLGPGTNGAITDGLQRDRWGIFAGVKERRVTAGVEWAYRIDGSETGLNTAAAPRVANDTTGRTVAGYVVARPTEWFSPTDTSNFSVVARFDRFTPNTSPTASAYAGTTPSYHYWVLGASYDLTRRVILTLDWQVQSPTNFPAAIGTNIRPTPRMSTIFAHWQATF